MLEDSACPVRGKRFATADDDIYDERLGRLQEDARDQAADGPEAVVHLDDSE